MRFAYKTLSFLTFLVARPGSCAPRGGGQSVRQTPGINIHAVASTVPTAPSAVEVGAARAEPRAVVEDALLNKGRVTQMRKTTMLAVAVVALMLLGAAPTFAAKGGGGGGMTGHAAAAPANFGGHSPRAMAI
jgi:hypothetical protein